MNLDSAGKQARQRLEARLSTLSEFPAASNFCSAQRHPDAEPAAAPSPPSHGFRIMFNDDLESSDDEDIYRVPTAELGSHCIRPPRRRVPPVPPAACQTMRGPSSPLPCLRIILDMDTDDIDDEIAALTLDAWRPSVGESLASATSSSARTRMATPLPHSSVESARPPTPRSTFDDQPFRMPEPTSRA